MSTEEINGHERRVYYVQSTMTGSHAIAESITHPYGSLNILLLWKLDAWMNKLS